MNLNDWFQKGMTPEAYIDAMEHHKDSLLHIYENFNLPEDEDLLEEIRKKNLRAIVLTEDWCGDAMLNVPIFLRIAEKTDIPIRMLLRDENLELMDQYLTNGKSRSIPIFIFIDPEGNEVAKWGPRAASIQEIVDASRAKLPPKDAENYDEAFKDMIEKTNLAFRENTDYWRIVYKSIIEKLQ